MQFGELFFDGDKKKIYEAPTVGFSFSIDGNGYRIYTPDDEPSAPTTTETSTYELWSRYVDFNDANMWSFLALSLAGGAYRYTDQFDEDKFSLIDLRLLNDWALVPANYPHNWYVKGNMFPNSTTNIDFDTDRISVNGVSPRIFFSDAGERTVADDEAIKEANENSVYASFGGGVWLDETSLYSDKGTDIKPNGNQERPVNNIPLAREIMADRGFNKLFIRGDCALGDGDDITNIKVVGDNPILTTLTIDTLANTLKASIYEARIQGILDGGITLRECLVDGINYVNGYIYNCVLTEKPIVLFGNTATAFIVRCESGYSQTNAPIIDCGGDGPTLIMKKYAGNVILKNKTGTNNIDIDLSSGDVRIDLTTVTNGNITVRGDGSVRNNVTGSILPSGTYGGMTLVNDTTPSKEEISSQVWTETTRSLTEGSGLDEAQLHDALDTYTNKDDYKATTIIASNMRGTDDANKIAPDNVTIGQIKTKVDALENYDDTAINLKLDNILSGLSSVILSIDALQSDIDTLGIDIGTLGTTTDSIFDYVKHQDRCVFVNEELVPAGDGTGENPFNDINNAVDYAELHGIRCIKLLSDATVTRNLKNFIVVGIGTYVLDCNGQNLDKSEFSHLIMRGTYTGQIIAQECVLDDGFRLNGFFDKNAVNGDLVCIGDVLFSNNFSNIPGLEKPSLSVDGHKVSIRNWSGGILIKDCDSATSEITVEVNQGKIYIENTCIDGLISCRGNATIDDQSLPGCIVDIDALINQELAERTARASHKIEGTQLVIYDDRGEIARWNLADVDESPSNENVFFRTRGS